MRHQVSHHTADRSSSPQVESAASGTVRYHHPAVFEKSKRKRKKNAQYFAYQDSIPNACMHACWHLDRRHSTGKIWLDFFQLAQSNNPQVRYSVTCVAYRSQAISKMKSRGHPKRGRSDNRLTSRRDSVSTTGHRLTHDKWAKQSLDFQAKKKNFFFCICFSFFASASE